MHKICKKLLGHTLKTKTKNKIKIDMNEMRMNDNEKSMR